MTLVMTAFLTLLGFTGYNLFVCHKITKGKIQKGHSQGELTELHKRFRLMKTLVIIAFAIALMNFIASIN